MSKRERRKKAGTDGAKLMLSFRAKSYFVAEVEKLVDLGLWIETDYLISHRFGDTRLLACAEPKRGVSFYLGDRKWRAAGRRQLKDGQYQNEFFRDHEGMVRHADIPMSRYVPEQRDFYEKDD